MHNKLEITINGEKKVFYNNMLSGYVDAITGKVAYSKYLAVGSGLSATSLDMKHLESFSMVLPLKTENYNFDVTKGELFLKKRLDIVESDPYVLDIGEIGLVGDSNFDNPIIVNRFVVGDSVISRAPGDEMTIEITIYFDFDISSKAVLTAGNNNLVKFFLGEEFDEEVSFSVARGTDTTTPTSEYIIKTNEDLQVFDATVNFSRGESEFEVNLDVKSCLGAGRVGEVLLLVCSEPALRINAGENFGFLEGIEEERIVDYDISVAFFVPALGTISGIYDSSGNLINPSSEQFGTGFGEIIDNPFGKNFSSTHKRAVSADEDLIIFYDSDNGANFIYSLADVNNIFKRSAEIVGTKGAYLVGILHRYLIVKRNIDGVHSVSAYYYNRSNYYENLTYNVAPSNYPALWEDQPWLNLEMVRRNNDANYTSFAYMIEATGCAALFNAYFNGTYNLSNTFTAGYTTGLRGDCSLASRTKASDAYFVGFNTKYNFTFNRTFTGIFNLNGSDQGTLVATMERDPGYPKVAKNFYYSVNSGLGKMSVFNIHLKNGKNFEFGECEKIYVSRNLDYIALRRKNKKFELFYFDGDANLYPFVGSFPSEISQEDIEDIVFFRDGILLFMADGTNKFVCFSKMGTLYYGLTRGDTVKFVYSADTTPGAGGEDVNVNFKVVADGGESDESV